MGEGGPSTFGWLPPDLLGAIVEVVTDGVLVVDGGGTILQANGAFGRMCRREPWELEGSPIEVLFAEDDLGIGGRIDELVADSTWTGQTRLRRSDGALLDCETWMRATDLDGGTVFVAVQHEPNVRRRYGQTVIDDIGARIHELVNSLASLRGYAELLRSEDPTVQSEAYERLEAASATATRRLEELLAEISAK